jgi:hypothetical protein
MALPKAMEDRIVELEVIDTQIAATETALAALPATPLEADLPDIVTIISDLTVSVKDLGTTLTAFINLIKTVRVNQ